MSTESCPGGRSRHGNASSRRRAISDTLHAAPRFEQHSSPGHAEERMLRCGERPPPKIAQVDPSAPAPDPCTPPAQAFGTIQRFLKARRLSDPEGSEIAVCPTARCRTFSKFGQSN
eukprot:CAMPEP_0173469830 /NCGR_PEP_ID=MMETSP1357-20121228/77562_1 /TAXON_ID=77926 /ORGANISM="Hemiselmis rufescens, Strain PCC563" /LENGTH=115 /DNA_ID=CAMNT_0014438083 /DNA_START=603 /DNA_END=948 /DNA_ORIENTATION=-